MRFSIIVAADEHNGIGIDGQLPWHLPADLKHFKNISWGMPILMGSNTYESIGKALPGRINIVLSRQVDKNIAGVEVAQNTEEAAQIAKKNGCKEIYIIGGAQVYESCIKLVDTIHLTRVHTIVQADTFFPALDTRWEQTEGKHFAADEKHGYSFTFETWIRKSAENQSRTT